MGQVPAASRPVDWAVGSGGGELQEIAGGLFDCFPFGIIQPTEERKVRSGIGNSREMQCLVQHTDRVDGIAEVFKGFK